MSEPVILYRREFPETAVWPTTDGNWIECHVTENDLVECAWNCYGDIDGMEIGTRQEWRAACLHMAELLAEPQP